MCISVAHHLASFETYLLDAVSGVQPTLERLLHLFGVIRGTPIDAGRGIYRADLIIEKPSIEVAREKPRNPGPPVAIILRALAWHVFSPRIILESLEYLISKPSLSERGEYQLTAAQQHLQENSDKYWCVISQGQRYDTGIPYGLMETQLSPRTEWNPQDRRYVRPSRAFWRCRLKIDAVAAAESLNN